MGAVTCGVGPINVSESGPISIAFTKPHERCWLRRAEFLIAQRSWRANRAHAAVGGVDPYKRMMWVTNDRASTMPHVQLSNKQNGSI